MGWDDLAHPKLCLSPSTHRLRLLRSVRALSQLARRIYLAKMQPNHLPRLADRLFCQNRRRNVDPVHPGVKPGHYLSNQGRSAPPVTLLHTSFFCVTLFHEIPGSSPGMTARRITQKTICTPLPLNAADTASRK